MCSRHAEYGAGYDITDAQMDGAQESHRTIEWSVICGLPHEYTNDDGMGIVVKDGGEDGAVGAICENCRDIREDWRNWMTARGYDWRLAA